MKALLLIACLSLLAIGCGGNPPTDAKNTATNNRDSDGTTKTPFDQSNEPSDIDLVAKIRTKVLEIDNLSVEGRNIKIITNGGKVSLRGPVKTDAERDAIVKIANDLAGGATHVTNQLEVAK